MIRNKKYSHWKIDGNRSWFGGRLNEIDGLLRLPGEESLEEEQLRVDSNAWEILEEDWQNPAVHNL